MVCEYNQVVVFSYDCVHEPITHQKNGDFAILSDLMELQKDFREMLELFNEHKVEYLIAGVYAQGEE